jgi:hypothetical protein
MAGELADMSLSALELAFTALQGLAALVHELPPVPAVVVLFAVLGLLAETLVLAVMVTLDAVTRPVPGRHAARGRCLRVDTLCPIVGDSPHGRHRTGTYR